MAVPERIARAILSAAIQEQRCGELMDCLMDGGTATVDIANGTLSLIDSNVIQSFLDDLNQD